MSAKYPSTLAPPGHAFRTLDVVHAVLEPYFTSTSTKAVLELCSGEGSHILEFGKRYSRLSFLSTEADSFTVSRISDRVRDEKVDNIEARVLDLVEETDWNEFAESRVGKPKLDVVFGINFLHMVPCPRGPELIFSRLKSLVSPSASLLFYGPYRNDAGFFTENDEKFDQMIKSRPNGSLLGLRSVEQLASIAETNGWELKKTVPMPVGNLILVFMLQ